MASSDVHNDEGLDAPSFVDDVSHPELQAGRFFAFDPPNVNLAGRNQRQHFLSDYEAYHFEKAEKERVDLFLDRQSELALKESKLLQKFGPLGSDMPPPKPPVLLDKTVCTLLFCSFVFLFCTEFSFFLVVVLWGVL
jgi:hypothetical protein